MRVNNSKSHPKINANQRKKPSFKGAYWTILVFLLFFLFLWDFSKKSEAVALQQPRQEATWDDMALALKDAIDRYPGEVGLFVKDLRSGRTFEYNADNLFVSASLIKVPIMAATFQAVKEGKIDLASKLRFNRRYRREGAGKIRYAQNGTLFSLDRLVQDMMKYSDNTATAMLVDQLGYEYLNDCFGKFGFETTRINPMGMSLSNRIDPTLDNYTTPREMAVFLEKIYRYQINTPELSERMVQIMKGVNSRNRLARYLPRDWQLAHKTGLLRRNCHDVGIVYTPRGDYIICVLTSQNYNYRMAKSFISTLSKRAYARMGST